MFCYSLSIAPTHPASAGRGREDRMSDYTDHMTDERNAQRALVIALAYPLALVVIVLALLWGAA